MSRGTFLLAYLAAIALGCRGRELNSKDVEPGIVHPEKMPLMLNPEPPFRYPPALYANKVQGNVTLRIYIDSVGAVWPESTTVVESSGYPGFDSAAVKGSQELHFSPAQFHGVPVGVSLLLPVYFRHPEGRPLPGDTILHRHSTLSTKP